MHNRLFFLLSTLSLSSASAANLNYPSYGIGTWNTSYAISADSHPNATKSVPFSIGAQNYTLQVNIAEIFPSNLDSNASIQNPSVAASFYNLLWSGTSTFNETLQNTWGLYAGVNYASVDNDTAGSLDQRSPLEIAYYRPGIHEAGDMTSYNREIERLHVVFLSGTGWGVTPVCTRVNTTRVKKNNDAVFSAAPESSRRNLYLSAALALVVTAFML
ncbi:hypothetical protein D6C86_06978 [Aureobasidium pullulans]|uniref:Uncharacterized protein n=1 Tax=Aureobasidium pullulans TaxID=5580 RepID=A0A4S9VYD7_AURPU|nr:hypothetical protein D6C94_07518 [Aureobasidium pullulans]THZ35823.1 hypothetical protein D6C88_10460 [Aureobasidium pullulans]THZ36609.1 hypothetical protein D6C87_09062 [Aureobasidium pullulans]THZ57669.1 hypothetical protein D6C86_06978 [Aureobasidium pullulans]